MIDQDMRRVVVEQRLGYVASVCPDGTANLSPKGTVAVWDEQHLVFAHIHSHQTVANIEAGNGAHCASGGWCERRGKRFSYKRHQTLNTVGVEDRHVCTWAV